MCGKCPSYVTLSKIPILKHNLWANILLSYSHQCIPHPGHSWKIMTYLRHQVCIPFSRRDYEIWNVFLKSLLWFRQSQITAMIYNLRWNRWLSFKSSTLIGTWVGPERHCERKMFCSRIQPNNPDNGSQSGAPITLGSWSFLKLFNVS